MYLILKTCLFKIGADSYISNQYHYALLYTIVTFQINAIMLYFTQLYDLCSRRGIFYRTVEFILFLPMVLGELHIPFHRYEWRHE